MRARHVGLLHALVASAVLLAGCAGDESARDPQPSASRASEPLTEQQVADAVLTVDDLPASLVPSRFSESEQGRAGSADALLTGAAECGFLFASDLPGPAPVRSADTNLTFGSVGTVVSSAVHTYASGDAEQAMAAALDQARACTSFSLDVGSGAVAQASAVTEETGDLGDEAVTTVVGYTVAGEPFLEHTRMAVRVEQDVVLAELVVFGSTAERLPGELVDAAVNRLAEVRAGTA